MSDVLYCVLLAFNLETNCVFELGFMFFLARFCFCPVLSCVVDELFAVSFQSLISLLSFNWEMTFVEYDLQGCLLEITRIPHGRQKEVKYELVS